MNSTRHSHAGAQPISVVTSVWRRRRRISKFNKTMRSSEQLHPGGELTLRIGLQPISPKSPGGELEGLSVRWSKKSSEPGEGDDFFRLQRRRRDARFLRSGLRRNSWNRVLT